MKHIASVRSLSLMTGLLCAIAPTRAADVIPIVEVRSNYFQTDDRVPSSAPAGSYSFVLLRRVVDGKLKTRMIAGEFYPKAKTFNAPGRYEIGAVLDLDGDGKLEVIVQAAYYEGDWTTIYRCTPAKIEELLVVACGV